MALAIPWRWALAAAGVVASPAFGQVASTASPPSVSLPSSPIPSAANPFDDSPLQVLEGVAQTTGSISETMSFDSNVARSSAQFAAARGLKPADGEFNTDGTVLLSRLVGRETVFLSGDVGYNEYVRNSVLDRSREHILGGAIGSIARCSGELTGGFNRQETDLADLALVSTSLAAERQVKNVTESSLVSLNATCGRGIGFAPTFSISRSTNEDTNSLYRFLDSNFLSGSAGIAYQSPVLGVLSLVGQYSKGEYPNNVFIGRSGLEGLEFRTVGGGATYTRLVGSRLEGTATLSYTDLESDSPYSHGFKGLTYAVNFSYRINPLLSMVGDVGRATTPSTRINSSYSVAETYILKFNYQLGARSTISAGVSRVHQDFGGEIIPLAVDLTEQTSDTAFGSVYFRLGRHLTLGATLQGQRRAANYPGLSYSDVLASLSARASF
jgi:hypothetical protein